MSTQKQRDFRKVIKTLKSCKTSRQLRVADKMADNFKEFYHIKFSHQYSDSLFRTHQEMIWKVSHD